MGLKPYVIIEGVYLVAADAPYCEVADLDQPGLRRAVGKGASYDLFLTRTLKSAQLERAEMSAAAVDLYFDKGLDSAAGVRQPLERVAAVDSRYRVQEGAFTSIRQVMAVPRQCEAGADYVRALVDPEKAEGFVLRVLAASGQAAVSVVS